MAELLLNIMGAFPEFKRSLIHERQREGIAIAKKNGAFKGRKRSVTDQQIATIRNRAAMGHKKAAIARGYLKCLWKRNMEAGEAGGGR